MDVPESRDRLSKMWELQSVVPRVGRFELF